jgi:hypothetical protein
VSYPAAKCRCEEIHLIAELNITLLRPEPPGQIITQAGDIDNRLKTLLDALKVPTEPNALPPNETPEQGETPFFCLLQDDNLITRISVSTDRWLVSESDAKSSDVVLLIHVNAKTTMHTWACDFKVWGVIKILSFEQV